MKTDLMIAALWLLITLLENYQWYWQGRRDQERRDKKIIDEKIAELVERVDAIIHRPDPNRPHYLDRQ